MAKSSEAGSGKIVAVVPPVPPSPTPVAAMPTTLVALKGGVRFIVQRVSEGMTLFVLLLSAVLAIAGIAEISSRHQARAQVDNTEREETALIMSQVSSATISATMPQQQRTEDVRPQILQDHFASVAVVRAYSMEARSELDSLSIRGAGPSRRGVTSILDGYLRDVSQVRSRLLRDWKLPSRHANERLAGASLNPLTWVEALGSWIEKFWAQLPLEQARTDFLLAIVVSCCALVGAIIAMLREGAGRFVTKQIVLGLASGFVAFLSLRGGRSVFMMELAGEVPNFNPYSMAFAGLLVGLFTRKAYELLSILVQELDSRLRAAMQGPSAAKPAPAAEPPQNP